MVVATSIAPVDRVELCRDATMECAAQYDRRIPCRIAETARVPRDAFGTRKRAQVRYYDLFKRLLEKDFFAVVRRGLQTRRSLEMLDVLGSWIFVLRDDAVRSPALEERLPNRQSLMLVWAANSLASEFAELYTNPVKG